MLSVVSLGEGSAEAAGVRVSVFDEHAGGTVQRDGDLGD